MIDRLGYQISAVDPAARRRLELRAGDVVRVHQKIEEKGKTRLQVFEGLVIGRKHGTEPGATFTVRKIASGVGVEKIFPLYSPHIGKIEIVRRSRVRRAKLYFIRTKAAKAIRRKMKTLAGFAGLSDETLAIPSAETPTAEAELTEVESSN